VTLPTWSAIFAALEVLWVAGAALWLVLERRSPVATLAWLLALAFMPMVGIGVYVFFGPRRIRRKRLRKQLARRSVAAQDEVRRLRQYQLEAALRALHGDAGMDLGMLAVATGEAPPMRCTEVRVIPSGRDCYRTLEEEIRRARHHVHLEYYIFEEGDVARRLRDALVDRARAGVQVRLLVDALGSRPLSNAFLAPLREAGGEVAFFNSVSLARFQPWYVNFRTHRKIAVVDGTTGMTGGMNVADDHDESVRGERAHRDTHVLLRGDAVAPLQLVFLEDWCFATGRAVLGTQLVHAPTRQGDRVVQIVASGPDDTSFAIHRQMFAAIAGSRRRVWLTTPYFVPDEPMLSALSTAALRGVDVRVLLPEAGDHPVVDAAARSYLPELLAAGVRVWTLGGRFLHAKTLVVDETIAHVGTANFDNRSFRLNFEVVAALYDAASIEEVAAQFLADLRVSRAVTLEELRGASLPRRLLESGARLLSPLL
jgi:cardiolipin synthase